MKKNKFVRNAMQDLHRIKSTIRTYAASASFEQVILLLLIGTPHVWMNMLVASKRHRVSDQELIALPCCSFCDKTALTAALIIWDHERKAGICDDCFEHTVRAVVSRVRVIEMAKRSSAPDRLAENDDE